MIRDLQSRARRFNAPVTLFLVFSLLATSLIFWGARLGGIENFLLGTDWPSQVWTVITYPWANMPYGDVLSLVFFFLTLYWMWFAGSEVERAYGNVKYLIVWFGSTLLGGLFLWLGAKLAGVPLVYGGFWLPVAAVTVCWCYVNPQGQIMLYGMIPINSRVLAIITAITLILVHGSRHPIIGFASALHLIPVAIFAAGKISLPSIKRTPKMEDRAYLKKSERMDKSYYDDVKKRETEREEKERLRKMFESSLNDDESKDR